MCIRDRDTVIKATASDQAIGKIYESSNNNIVAGVDYTIPVSYTHLVIEEIYR